MYAKVIKWISWVLLILGAIIGVYGFIVGFEDNGNAPVDYVLYWAYAMVAVALIAVLLGVGSDALIGKNFIQYPCRNRFSRRPPRYLLF